jgi:hypothetical protein
LCVVYAGKKKKPCTKKKHIFFYLKKDRKKPQYIYIYWGKERPKERGFSFPPKLGILMIPDLIWALLRALILTRHTDYPSNTLMPSDRLKMPLFLKLSFYIPYPFYYPHPVSITMPIFCGGCVVAVTGDCFAKIVAL